MTPFNPERPDTIRPLYVRVEWTEAGDALAAEGEELLFADFERRAHACAMAHKNRGYLKTKIVVFFDSGDTYGCRLDLAYRDAHGFEHHAKTFLREWSRGQDREMPQVMREGYAECAALLERIDFTPLVAPSTELTATGEQYVIPGCERNATSKPGQMDLFG